MECTCRRIRCGSSSSSSSRFIMIGDFDGICSLVDSSS